MEGFWGARSVLYLYLKGGHMDEHLRKNALMFTLKICALSASLLNLNLKIKDFNQPQK